ncbi:hypothetical protein EV363DRAFT_1583521 [Boletus edulis]|nr:hypothetical protein EV363DRAFT_1583521 [Boletus edulis]
MNLLMILNNLFALVPAELSDPASPTFARVYELLSHLFLTFRSNSARLALTSTFEQLAILHLNLQDLAWLLESLKFQCVFYETHQRNQFDRRLAVFTTLNEERYLTLSPRNWLPVLYNALHFVQEELAIRNDAAITLRRFVGVVASDRPSAAEAEPLFVRTVFPALKNALRSKAEPVRTEVRATGIFAASSIRDLS